MGERESFGANEIQARGVSYGHRFRVGTGEDLDPARNFGRFLYCCRDDGHRRRRFPGATALRRYGASCIFSIMMPWTPSSR